MSPRAPQRWFTAPCSRINHRWAPCNAPRHASAPATNTSDTTQRATTLHRALCRIEETTWDAMVKDTAPTQRWLRVCTYSCSFLCRSHKEKQSSYAPEIGVRYDGIYRIEKCWRKNGKQGYKVCRYLFVRCDNDPAPWTSDNYGDHPRPLPVIKELKNAIDITERKGSPFWDYDEDKACWLWKKPPPHGRKQVDRGNLENGKRVGKVKRLAQNGSARQKFLEELSCLICQKVMRLPLTTPCGHNFCQACLEGVFAGQSFIRQRKYEGWRTLRVQKNIMRCPSCSNDIADFLQNAQVNRELMGVIELLQQRSAEMHENSDESSEETDTTTDEPDTSDNETEIHNQRLQEVKDKALKTQPASKPLLTYKRKKANGQHGNSDDAGWVETVEFVPVNPESVDAKKVQKVTVDNKFKQTYRRRKSKNGGNLLMQKEAVDNKFKWTYKRKLYKTGHNLPTLGTTLITMSERAKIAAAE